MLPEQVRLLRWRPILSRTVASIFAHRTLLTVSLTQECPWWDSDGAKQLKSMLAGRVSLAAMSVRQRIDDEFTAMEDSKRYTRSTARSQDGFS